MEHTLSIKQNMRFEAKQRDCEEIFFEELYKAGRGEIKGKTAMRDEVKRSTLAPRRGRPQEAGTYTYPSQHIQQYRDCHDRLGGCRNGFGRHRSARMTS